MKHICYQKGVSHFFNLNLGLLTSKYFLNTFFEIRAQNYMPRLKKLDVTHVNIKKSQNILTFEPKYLGLLTSKYFLNTFFGIRAQTMPRLKKLDLTHLHNFHFWDRSRICECVSECVCVCEWVCVCVCERVKLIGFAPCRGDPKKLLEII